MRLSARRLVSPVGFLLALVFFLLSFAAVSFDAAGFGSVDVSYTGVDLVTNGVPGVTGTGQFASAPATGPSPGPNVPAGTQILAVLTALLLVGGLIATLAPMPAAATRARGRGGVIGLSVVALGLLVITELVFTSELDSAVAGAPQTSQSYPVTVTNQTGIGFWLSLLTLVLVFGFAVGSVLWDRMQQSAAEQVPPAQP